MPFSYLLSMMTQRKDQNKVGKMDKNWNGEYKRCFKEKVK